MPASEPLTPDATRGWQPHRATDRPDRHHVLACVDAAPFTTDAAPFARAVLSYAVAMAKAIGARLTILHVLESPAAQEPMDPVDWALRHRNAIEYLHEHISRFGDLDAEAVILAGPPAERINTWAHDNGVDLIVLGRGGENESPFVGLGDTARRIAGVANASALLVPPTSVNGTPIQYRKVLIPLDGSSRSECVLPLSLEIATAHDAEVVLVHAAPKADLIEADLRDAEAIALREQLYRRNEHAARQYLDWIRSRLSTPPAIRTRLLASGDARHSLTGVAAEERADLMVLSPAGKGGHADMAVGSVADYLINRMNIPILLVRQHRGKNPPEKKSDHAIHTRPPSQGMM